MNRIRKFLASLLLVLITASSIFPSFASAQSGRFVEDEESAEKKKEDEPADALQSNSSYPSNVAIAAITFGALAVPTFLYYWFSTRHQNLPNNDGQNAGMLIVGAIAQNLANVGDGGLNGLGDGGQPIGDLDPTAQGLDLVQPMLLDNNILLEEPGTQDDINVANNEVANQEEVVANRPKARRKKADFSTTGIANHFLGNDFDPNAPRSSRSKTKK